MNMRSISFEREGKMMYASTWTMLDMKEFCDKEGLGLTCSANCARYDVSVIMWKEKREGEEEAGEQSRSNNRSNESDQRVSENSDQRNGEKLA